MFPVHLAGKGAKPCLCKQSCFGGLNKNAGAFHNCPIRAKPPNIRPVRFSQRFPFTPYPLAGFTPPVQLVTTSSLNVSFPQKWCLMAVDTRCSTTSETREQLQRSATSVLFPPPLDSDWAGQFIRYITDSSTYLSSACNFTFHPSYLLQPQISI